METRVKRTFLHPELSDVVLLKQTIYGNLTSDFEIHIYNAQSQYKRSFDLQTKTGISDLKQYTDNLKEMVDVLEKMRYSAEYGKFLETHGDNLL